MTEVIEVNADKPCTSCGVMGALENGLCMECAVARFDKIGPRVMVVIGEQVDSMLRMYAKQINQAYKNDDELKVAFSVDLKPGTGRDVVVTTKMSFIESRVKEELSQVVDEAQPGLFEEKIRDVAG